MDGKRFVRKKGALEASEQFLTDMWTIENSDVYNADPELFTRLVVLESAYWYCNAEGVTGKTCFASGSDYCFQLVTDVVSGQIIGDGDDPQCHNKSGTGIPFSNYGGFATANTLLVFIHLRCSDVADGLLTHNTTN